MILRVSVRRSLFVNNFIVHSSFLHAFAYILGENEAGGRPKKKKEKKSITRGITYRRLVKISHRSCSLFNDKLIESEHFRMLYLSFTFRSCHSIWIPSNSVTSTGSKFFRSWSFSTSREKKRKEIFESFVRDFGRLPIEDTDISQKKRHLFHDERRSRRKENDPSWILLAFCELF